ncbi:unnamed protein product [Urochloa humidicola]
MDLAMGVSEATIIKSLVTKLGTLLAEEYTLVRGVRGDIQFIKDELASMQAFLSNLAHSNDGHDDQTEDWMKQIREVAYDIEDCVDTPTASILTAAATTCGPSSSGPCRSCGRGGRAAKLLRRLLNSRSGRKMWVNGAPGMACLTQIRPRRRAAWADILPLSIRRQHGGSSASTSQWG